MASRSALAAALVVTAFALAAFSCAQSDTTTGPTCGPGEDQCSAGCTNLKIDSDNCGKCDQKCASGTVCVSGACASACPNGDSICGSDGGAATCVNTKSDNSNCGKCGHACPQG